MHNLPPATRFVNWCCLTLEMVVASSTVFVRSCMATLAHNGTTLFSKLVSKRCSFSKPHKQAKKKMMSNRQIEPKGLISNLRRQARTRTRRKGLAPQKCAPALNASEHLVLNLPLGLSDRGLIDHVAPSGRSSPVKLTTVFHVPRSCESARKLLCSPLVEHCSAMPEDESKQGIGAQGDPVSFTFGALSFAVTVKVTETVTCVVALAFGSVRL